MLVHPPIVRVGLLAASFLGCAYCPSAAAVERLIVSGYFSDKVHGFNGLSGKFVQTLGPGGSLNGPQAIRIGPDGRIYVVSEESDRILRYDAITWNLIDAFIVSSGELDAPTGLEFMPNGDLLVASFSTDAVLRYDGGDGSYLGEFVPPGTGGLDGPDTGMTLGPDGHLYVPSFWGSAILRYDGESGESMGVFIKSGTGGLKYPRSIEFRDDYAYVTSSGSGKVLRFDAESGEYVDVFIAGSPLQRPVSLAWDERGAIYVADDKGNSVLRYDAVSGDYIDTFVKPGSGGLNGPTHVLFVPHVDFLETRQFGTGRNTLSIAWSDFDGDGDPDLATLDSGAQGNRLYVNNADGSYTARDEFGGGTTFALAWGDYDNDGDPDAAVGNNNDEQSYLYVNEGEAGFSQSPQFGADLTCALAWGDYDNDGDLDLAVGNGILGIERQNYLYVNLGNGTFAGEPQFGAGQTDSLAWGDFDNDGDLDLAVGNGGFVGPAQNFLYVNNSDGSFTERAEFGAGDTTSVAWGDFDNDGDLDLAVANWGGDASALYVNNGDGTFTGRNEFGARDTNTCAWGDADNDGDLDLAVGNGDFGGADQNFLYVNRGDGSFSEVAFFGRGSTDAVAWADSDADGDLDLAVGNEHTPTTNYLYVNEQNDGKMLALRLVGRYHDRGLGFSNRDGIGAMVRVYAAGKLGDGDHLRGLRQIEATGGFSAQSSIEAEFGLPNDETVDIRIEWPGSGGKRIVQDLTGWPATGRFTIEEAGLRPGDLNCDDSVDFGDIDPFVTVLTDLNDYELKYPACEYLNGDMNGSGSVDFDDIDPFVACLTGGGC